MYKIYSLRQKIVYLDARKLVNLEDGLQVASLRRLQYIERDRAVERQTVEFGLGE